MISRLKATSDCFVLRLFDRSWAYYDAIYDAVGKDYRSETKRLLNLIERHKRSPGNSLLDVGCGTGRHVSYLKKQFHAEGLDVNARLLGVARRRNRAIPFHKGNMLTFSLPKRFDVVTCLFSAIGHMRTRTNLRRAILNMSRHLKPGGVLIVEPWLTPHNFKSGTVHAVLVNQPALKIARVGRSVPRGKISTIDYQYMIATPKSTQWFRESEKFGLFTHSEYLTAFRLAGLKVDYDGKGLVGRGLYIGVRR